MSMTICGYVTDDNGNGINGATVNLYVNGSTSPASSTTTTADANSQSGYWTFTNVADALYYVKVTYQGHVRAIYGASCVQFNNLVIGADAFHVDSSGNMTANNVGTLADQSFLNSPVLALKGSYDSNAGVGSITQTYKSMQLQNKITASGGTLTSYKLSVQDDGGVERWSVDNAGNATIGASLVVPTIGPSSTQQHTLPAVASDTVELVGATQSPTHKTFDSTSNVPVVLGEIVVSVSTAAVTFSNIPQGYRHLRLTGFARDDGTGVSGAYSVQFNLDSSTNYQYEVLSGFTNAGTPAGATQVYSAGTSATNLPEIAWSSRNANGQSLNTYPTFEMIIPYYSNTSYKKSYRSTFCGPGIFTGTGAGGGTGVIGGWWEGTAAITSISLWVDVGSNFISGCIFTLEGIPT